MGSISVEQPTDSRKRPIDKQRHKLSTKYKYKLHIVTMHMDILNESTVCLYLSMPEKTIHYVNRSVFSGHVFCFFFLASSPLDFDGMRNSVMIIDSDIQLPPRALNMNMRPM